MACNSVAVSSAVVSQFVLDQAGLRGLVAKLTGVAVDGIEFYERNQGDRVNVGHGKKRKVVNGYEFARVVTPQGINVMVVQQTVDGETTLKLQVSGTSYNTTAVNKLAAELQPAFEKATIIAQQTAVLRRLAELGKLSNITQKDGGVTARIEVTI